MKYLIVSDIHGSLTRLQQVLDYYSKAQCNRLCILGDILNYGPRNGLPEGLDPKGIAEYLNCFPDPIITVRGNCDSEVDQMLLDFPILADYALVADNGKSMFLTHGHIYNEEHMPKGKHDVFFYGHTHLWKLKKQQDTWICNTGSVTFPKGGNVPTFALYENGTISICQLDGTPLESICLE